MRWQRCIRVVFICFVAISLVISGTAGPVMAQDDEVPTIPGVYYGELSISDGTIDQPILIEAVADGEVQDTIIAEPDGTFGGPTIADDELEVQEPDSGEVEFHVGGTPVEIVSLEGEVIEDTVMPWDSGTQEVQLEADTDTIASALSVGIADAPTTAEAGTNVTIGVSVDNIGPVAATQEIELVDGSGAVVDTTSVTLGIGNTTSETLTWAINETTSGPETLTVRSGNENATTTIEVERSDTPSVAPAPGGGGGAGGNPGAIDDTNHTEEGADGGISGTLTETQSIVSSADFELSQVRFTTDSNVVAITWESTNISGDVTTIAYNQTPTTVGSVPGAMVTLSEVTVPENMSETPAVVEQRVARERLNEINTTVDNLQTYRYTNETWTPVETEVTAETDTEVRIESEVPGFSYLAVSAVGEPTAAVTVPSSVTVGDEVMLDGSGSRNQYGSITTYNWSVAGETLTGETVTTTFAESGNIEVTLTVTNDAGETDVITETVAVEAESESSTGDKNNGTDTGAGTDGNGETDETSPGFGSALTVLTFLGGLFIIRRFR